MKRHLRLLLLTLLCTVYASAWATSITYTFTKYTWTADPANWVSGKDGDSWTKDNGIEVTKIIGNNGVAYATSPISYDNITKVEVQYRSGSNGKGTIEVQVGDNAAKSFTVNKDISSFKTATFNYNPYQSGKVKLTVTETGSGIGITNIIYIKSITITTFDGNQYMTYCSDQDLDFTGKDLKAYRAVSYLSDQQKVVIQKMDQVPAGTGILIKSDNSDLPVAFTNNLSDYQVAKGTVPASEFTNMLVGVTTATTIQPAQGENTVFVLANGSKGIAFYPISDSGGTIAANKAYLLIPTALLDDWANSSPTITFDDGSTDAITTTRIATPDNNWYTIQGIRVTAPTIPGIYIHNGRTVVVK